MNQPVNTIEFIPNSYCNAKEADRFVREIFAGIGKGKRKFLKKEILCKLAAIVNIDRKEFCKAIIKKHGGHVPSVDGKPICLLTAYILEPSTLPITFFRPDIGTNGQLIEKINKLSAEFGYSYGAFALPSMRLHSGACQSDYLNAQLPKISECLSLFFKIVYQNIHLPQISAILFHKAPQSVSLDLCKETKHVSICTYRPDIVISPDSQLYVTEIESAPGGHGILSTHEILFKNNSNLVDQFAEYLEGRSYRVIVCKEWLDYLWEQAAFCNLLKRFHNIDAKVIATASHDDLRKHSLNWVAQKNKGHLITDPVAHAQRPIFSDTIIFDPDINQDTCKRSVTLRFGYFNNFNQKQLRAIENSHTVINGMLPYFESKNLLALAHSKDLENIYKGMGLYDEYITLASYIPFTEILTKPSSNKAFNILKLSGWDEQAWGARSVIVGEKTKQLHWEEKAAEYLKCESPAVVQRFIPSMRFSLNYINPDRRSGKLTTARLRISPIIVDNKILVTGLTFRNDDKVHGASDAVQSFLFGHNSALESRF